MSILTIKGIVAFSGINHDETSKKTNENIKLYVEDVPELLSAVKNIQLVEKRAKSPLKEIKPEDIRLQDLPSSYKHFINVKNKEGTVKYFNADKSDATISDIKTGDEVRVQINLALSSFGVQKFASAYMLKVGKITSQKYKFLPISPEELKAADDDFFNKFQSEVGIINEEDDELPM